MPEPTRIAKALIDRAYKTFTGRTRTSARNAAHARRALEIMCPADERTARAADEPLPALLAQLACQVRMLHSGEALDEDQTPLTPERLNAIGNAAQANVERARNLAAAAGFTPAAQQLAVPLDLVVEAHLIGTFPVGTLVTIAGDSEAFEYGGDAIAGGWVTQVHENGEVNVKHLCRFEADPEEQQDGRGWCWGWIDQTIPVADLKLMTGEDLHEIQQQLVEAMRAAAPAAPVEGDGRDAAPGPDWMPDVDMDGADPRTFVRPWLSLAEVRLVHGALSACHFDDLAASFGGVLDDDESDVRRYSIAEVEAIDATEDAPPAAPVETGDGAALIAAERRRQVEQGGDDV